MDKTKAFLIIIPCIITFIISGCTTTPVKTTSIDQWQSTFDETLHEFGHRNWIVIADYAYPSQSGSGIKTISTGKEQGEVLSYVLKQIEASPHVKPIILLDEELEYIPEKDAPGIEAYRTQLNDILNGKEISIMPHEQIIRHLDEGAKLFNILILKTTLTIPYTSVFINLDCNYWSAEKEAALRERIAD